MPLLLLRLLDGNATSVIDTLRWQAHTVFRVQQQDAIPSGCCGEVLAQNGRVEIGVSCGMNRLMS